MYPYHIAAQGLMIDFDLIKPVLFGIAHKSPNPFFNQFKVGFSG